jgi:hypothetical protein
MSQLFGTCYGCYNHLLCKKDGLCTEPLSCEYYFSILDDENPEEVYDEEQTRQEAYREVLNQFN